MPKEKIQTPEGDTENGQGRDPTGYERIQVPRNRIRGHTEVPRETPMRAQRGWLRTEARDRIGNPGVVDSWNPCTDSRLHGSISGLQLGSRGTLGCQHGSATTTVRHTLGALFLHDFPKKHTRAFFAFRFKN